MSVRCWEREKTEVNISNIYVCKIINLINISKEEQQRNRSRERDKINITNKSTEIKHK